MPIHHQTIPPLTLRDWLARIVDRYPHARLDHEHFGSIPVASALAVADLPLDDIAALIAPIEAQVPGEIILMTEDAAWWFITTNNG